MKKLEAPVLSEKEIAYITELMYSEGGQVNRYLMDRFRAANPQITSQRDEELVSQALIAGFYLYNDVIAGYIDILKKGANNND
ncbi:hypothetical protein J2S74_005414 [Evansella vedderi]|uniref:Uncharacterized protein n=1 Tax=Evansella vedderi TaxID=38282 RepID=A0ABU0A4Q9_9BACI|nr:hypothetical protein [Evansella vedderi]MDQ0257951.1 hypothetical protein [Evansella vedderi]